MNEIYIIDGKKFRVGLINKDDFLQKNPTAELFVEEETMGPEENPNVEGKPEVAATPVATAVTEDTASQSGVGSLDLQESKYKTPLTLEEKKSLQNNKFSKQMSKENNFTKERLLELQNPQDNGFSYRNEMTLDEQIQDHKKVSKEIMTGTAAYDKDFFKQYNKEDRENLVKLGKPNYVTTLPKYNSDGSLSEDMSYVFTTQALKDINSNIDTSKKEYETTKTELEEGLDYKQKQKQRSQSLFNDLWKNDTYVNEVLYPEIIASSEKEIAEAREAYIKKYNLNNNPTPQDIESANKEFQEEANFILEKNALGNEDLQDVRDGLMDLAVNSVDKDLNEEIRLEGRKNLTTKIPFTDIIISRGVSDNPIIEGLQTFGKNTTKAMYGLELMGESAYAQNLTKEIDAIRLRIENGQITDNDIVDYEVTMSKKSNTLIGKKTGTAKEAIEYLQGKLDKQSKEEFDTLVDINKLEKDISLFNKAEIFDEDGVTWKDLGLLAGSQLPQMALALFGSGVGASAQMIGNGYVDNLKTIARKEFKLSKNQEPTIDQLLEIINSGKDQQALAAVVGLVGGKLESISAKGLFKVELGRAVGSLVRGEGKLALQAAARSGVGMAEGGLAESLTETLQTGMEQLSGVYLSDGEQSLDFKGLAEAAGQGGIMGVLIPGGINIIRQTNLEFKQAIMKSAAGLGLDTSYAKLEQHFKNIELNISKANFLTEKDKRQRILDLGQVRNTLTSLPKILNAEQREQALDLLITKKGIQSDFKDVDPKLIPESVKERIEAIDNELVSISETAYITSTVDMAMKEGLGENMFSANTTVEADALAADNNISMVDSEGQRSEGAFSADGKTVIIDLEQAKKVGAFNVAGHELLHRVLFNTLYKEVDGKLVGSDVARSLGLELDKQLNRIDPSILKNSYLKSRLELYKNEGKSMLAEEKLTILSDALRLGAITIDETGIDKFNSYFRRLFQNLGWKKIKFKDGKSVVNFIQDYNKSLDKGAFGKSIKQGANEGFEVVRGKDGIKKLKDDFEVIVKQSRSEDASNKVQELYDTQGDAAAFDIIEQFKPITSKIVEKRSQAPGFDRQLLTDEIETGKRGIFDLIKEYNPESGVPLAAYINKFLPARAIEASRRILGEEFTDDITEAKGVAAEEVSVTEKPTDKSTTSKLRRVLGIKQDDATYNLAKEVSGKILSGDLPGKKVKTAINKEARKSKLRKAVSDLMGTEKAIDEQFLNKNILDIVKALPASDLVKLEREAKVKVLAEQGPRLNVKDAREAVNKGLLPKDTNLQSGPKVSSKLPITLEQAKEFFTQKRKAGLVNVITEMLVKDAAPEVTESKMEPAKRAKILSEIDRAPALKFSKTSLKAYEMLVLQALNQAKDINAAGVLSGIKGSITVSDLNRKNKQNQTLEAIEKFGLTPNVFQSAMPASSGAVRAKLNQDNATSRKLALFLDKNNIKANKNTYYYALDNGDWIKSVKSKSGKSFYVPEGVVNLVASRGRLYYGVKDPAYVEALSAAKNNLKGKTELKPKKVNGKYFSNEAKEQSKINMEVLEDVVLQLEKAVDKGMDPSVAALLIAQGYQATGGIIKIAAGFKYESKNPEYGTSAKQRKGKKYREEHNPPASVVGANLIWAIVNNKVSIVMPKIKENYSQTLLSKADDQKLDSAKLDATLPKGTTILDNPVVRISAAGINLNSIVNVETGQTLAEENGIGVDAEIENNLEVYTKQNELILKLNSNKEFTNAEAKKQIDQFVKVAPSIAKASKSNNNKSAFKYSKTPTNKVTVDTAAKTDEALSIARDLNAPIKKIRVFDFDDTLAQTKSDVLYTMPDGTEGKLNAEQFANDGSTLLSEGAVFDFSEFNKVTEGKKGPLFKVAQTIAAKRGTEDVFVLTARAPESQLAIYEFLKSQGLDIPLKNITGLGNSTGDAKARWIVDKAADGYNDFYFADDAPQNVKAVKDALSVIDVKSKTQQAKIKFSKSLDLDKDFNDIIENKTGIGSDKTYSRVKAQVAGASKGKFNFFIPPSAEDFVGLLYSTLGKGDVGDAQMAWYKSHLLNPFARAMENLANDRANMMQDFRGLKKSLGIVPKNLRKKIKDSNFTKEQAVRAYIWDKQGMEIPGISQKDQKDLVDFVNADAELVVFGDQLIEIGKGDAYAAPDAGWVAGNIGTDFMKALNTTKRSKYLEAWQQNVDQIFSEANLNKLEAAYGANYREAMVDMLKRMKTGKNTSSGSDRLAARFTDWLTNSVGAIMFFNTRSAVLQTISAVNFINFSDNNVLKAGAAFANQPQYWSDFKKLFNSPFLLDRRSGLKLNVNEADIAAMAKGPGNGARNVIAGILKAGFLPTQLADSFAIASGGASFYRNRIKALQKEGLTEAEAEEQAFRDFREIAEESQQSSRPDKISQQQAGPLGRVVLAFANTPAQYARLIKKAGSDLKNGRGDAKTNISKIIYYGVAQNLLFSALQQALFAIAFDDEEEEEKKNEKYFNIVNGMSDSILRGIGIGGAIVSVVKNTALRLAKEADKKSPKYQDAVVKGVLQISPPISSKVGKLQSAGRSYSWNQEEMRTRGWSIDNPAYLANANVISALTNVPLDRAVKKVTNIVDAGNENIEYYKRIALALGWSAWELGIDKKGGKVAPPKTDMDKLYDLNKKQQIDSLTSLGISKKQIKLLKLEEDRVNAILNPKSIKPIKVSKKDSLFGLNKKDQVKALEKLGLTKKEIRALRLESDRVEAIINKQKEEVK